MPGGARDVAALLAPLADRATTACVRAERAVSRALGGSCSLPLAAYAECSEKLVRALVASSDGKRVIRCDLEGEAATRKPRASGPRPLRAQGADESLASESLRGRGILVTRPGERAQQLARLIEGAGGRAHLFPAIEIEDLPPPRELEQLDKFDLAVFVSPTAVSKIMAHLAAWPRACRRRRSGAAPGASSSARRLSVIAPQAGADSEALLALPEMQQVAGKRIVIFAARAGASCSATRCAAAARRVRGELSAHASHAQRLWKGEIDAVTVSSSQGLANLFEVLDDAFLRASRFSCPTRASPVVRASGRCARSCWRGRRTSRCSRRWWHTSDPMADTRPGRAARFSR